MSKSGIKLFMGGNDVSRFYSNTFTMEQIRTMAKESACDKFDKWRNETNPTILSISLIHEYDDDFNKNNYWQIEVLYEVKETT